MRRVLLFALVLMLVSSFAALAAEPIKIGVNLELTGAVAAYGQMGLDAMQFYVKNWKPTALGRPVELVIVDNKSDKVEAANATNRLIQKEKVSAIVGTMTSGNLLSAGPIAEKYKVPIVGPTATNPLVTQGKEYVFRACFTDDYQAKIAAKFAYEELGARRVAVISDIAQDYCVALGRFFATEFEKLGGKIVSTQYMKTLDQDFSAQLTAIKSANPDLIYSPNYYTEDALIADQARDLGIEVPILSADGADAPELIQIGKEAVEGLYHTAMWHEDVATGGFPREFADKYKEDTGDYPNAFGAMAVDSLMLIIDAIERAGSDDPVAIRDALEASENVEVLTGKISIENGDAIRGVLIKKVEDGEAVIHIGQYQ